MPYFGVIFVELQMKLPLKIWKVKEYAAVGRCPSTFSLATTSFLSPLPRLGSQPSSDNGLLGIVRLE